MGCLVIEVRGLDDSDAIERAELVGDLRSLLERAAGVELIDARSDAPEHAKGPGIEIAGLLVAITGGLPGLIQLIEQWRSRRGAGSVVIRSMHGDELMLTNATPEEREAAIGAFVEIAQRDRG